MAKSTEPPDESTFGGRLAVARERAGMTQAALGRAIAGAGLQEATGATISKYERNMLPAPEGVRLVALARTLGVDVDWLVLGERPQETMRLDDDPVDDPVLQAFLATEAGLRCTPEEVQALAAIPRRLGRARDTNVYVGLLSLLRYGFDAGALADAEERRRKLEERAIAEGRTIVKD